MYMAVPIALGMGIAVQRYFRPSRGPTGFRRVIRAAKSSLLATIVLTVSLTRDWLYQRTHQSARPLPRMSAIGEVSSSPNATIIWVHGTWQARRISSENTQDIENITPLAAWPLLSALQQQFPRTNFFRFDWFADNRQTSRDNAVQVLSVEVARLRAASGTPIVIIGHSYGGAVAADVASGFVDDDRVTSVTLAAPFFDVTTHIFPRDQADGVMVTGILALAFWPSLILIFGFALLAYYFGISLPMLSMVFGDELARKISAVLLGAIAFCGTAVAVAVATKTKFRDETEKLKRALAVKRSLRHDKVEAIRLESDPLLNVMIWLSDTAQLIRSQILAPWDKGRNAFFAEICRAAVTLLFLNQSTTLCIWVTNTLASNRIVDTANGVVIGFFLAAIIPAVGFLCFPSRIFMEFGYRIFDLGVLSVLAPLAGALSTMIGMGTLVHFIGAIRVTDAPAGRAAQIAKQTAITKSASFMLRHTKMLEEPDVAQRVQQRVKQVIAAARVG